ncbi:glycosyl hydrolase family 28 protein [Roseimaritima sediminicola]|uniref:glycosyl hydrolase family 28 protein n=1 Tax=Roseimaritima sediminicola TaxID=2662066 RepID=UPI0012984580|nr:glycosyl hydrolase family 28 protein [Roseimaritima sediminicola]
MPAIDGSRVWFLVRTGFLVLCCGGLLLGGFAQAQITPNQFEGSDVERINQAIATAAKTGQPVVVPRINRTADGEREIWMLDSAILVRSNTYLELQNCHLKLSDTARDNLIRSANCGMGITDIQPLNNITIIGTGRVTLEGADNPRSTGDSAKVLGQRTYGTDAGVAGTSQTGDWRNIGILMAYVDHFRLENLFLKDAHSWAISLERCAHGVIRDIEFAAEEGKLVNGKREVFLNQDGLDLRQGCHDIEITNISGHTGDDLIALTNIVNDTKTAGSPDYIMVSRPNNRGDGLDDIRAITIRNVRGYTAGGHHIVRLLNASGLKIHDVILDGLIDTSSGRPAKAAVRIGDANPAWGGVTPLGDTRRILINNVISRARHSILIAGSLVDSSITNVIHYGAAADPVGNPSGPEHLRNVTFENVRNVKVPSPAE